MPGFCNLVALAFLPARFALWGRRAPVLLVNHCWMPLRSDATQPSGNAEGGRHGSPKVIAFLIRRPPPRPPFQHSPSPSSARSGTWCGALLELARGALDGRDANAAVAGLLASCGGVLTVDVPRAVARFAELGLYRPTRSSDPAPLGPQKLCFLELKGSFGSPSSSAVGSRLWCGLGRVIAVPLPS